MSVLTTLTPAFRRRCEAISTAQRNRLGLRAFDPLPAAILAEALGARIVVPADLPDLPAMQAEILASSPSWSAAILIRDPLTIVHNPAHGPTRQEANLMHELAHVLLDHKMVYFDPITGLPGCHPQDEVAATYLGGCLQIPRRGLLWAAQCRMDVMGVATHFGTSVSMVSFRCNVTGVSITNL
jgi:hypothetical protein